MLIKLNGEKTYYTRTRNEESEFTFLLLQHVHIWCFYFQPIIKPKQVIKLVIPQKTATQECQQSWHHLLTGTYCVKIYHFLKTVRKLGQTCL